MTALRAEGCGLPLCGNAYKVSVTCLPSRPHSHSERSEESRYTAYLRQSVVNTHRREGPAGRRGESYQLSAISFQLLADSGLMLLDSSSRYVSRCFAAEGGIYTGADRRPPQPSQPQAVSPLRTFGAKAPSILRTFPLASGNTSKRRYASTTFPPTFRKSSQKRG